VTPSRASEDISFCGQRFTTRNPLLWWVAALLLVLGTLVSPGSVQAGETGQERRSRSAVRCAEDVQVDKYRVEVARSRTTCPKALKVSRLAYQSYAEDPRMGDRGIVAGFRCIFGPAWTKDFSTPAGPILLCRSWNRYVVASAEPSDPPTNWTFETPFLSKGLAERYAIGKVVRKSGRRWSSFQSRSVDCSRKRGRLIRRCSLGWSANGTRFSATFRVRMIPRRWKDPKVVVRRKSTRAPHPIRTG
jgi:hypothetical protein